MSSSNISGGTTAFGRIEWKKYDDKQLRDEIDDYDELSDEEKLEAVTDVAAVDEGVVTNVTTDALHNYFARNLNPTSTAAEDNIDINWIGLGTNSGGGISTSDTDLNNRVFSKQNQSESLGSKSVQLDFFIGSGEANGNTYNELGMFTGDPANLSNDDVFMVNHASFSGIDKQSGDTITLQVTLNFSDT